MRRHNEYKLVIRLKAVKTTPHTNNTSTIIVQHILSDRRGGHTLGSVSGAVLPSGPPANEPDPTRRPRSMRQGVHQLTVTDAYYR